MEMNIAEGLAQIKGTLYTEILYTYSFFKKKLFIAYLSTKRK